MIAKQTMLRRGALDAITRLSCSGAACNNDCIDGASRAISRYPCPKGWLAVIGLSKSLQAMLLDKLDCSSGGVAALIGAENQALMRRLMQEASASKEETRRLLAACRTLGKCVGTRRGFFICI